MEQETYTLAEALKYLDISQGTFFKLIREYGIRPIGYNPALRRQKKPRYSKVDIDRIKSGSIFRAA